MIGIQYRPRDSENNRMTIHHMTSIPPITGCSDGDFIADGDNTMTKKPSLLRNQLRRTTNRRTKKRASATVISIEDEITVEVHAVPDSPTESSLEKSDSDDVPSSPSVEESISNDTDPELIAAESDESKKRPLDTGTSDDTDPADIAKGDTECSIENSNIPDSDERVDEEVDNADDIVNISEIHSDDEESKTEAEPEQPQQLGRSSKPTTTGSTVSTTNLSIVLTGTDIVVEYRDDKDGKQKETSPNNELFQQCPNQAQTPTSIVATFLSPLGLSPSNTVSSPSPTQTSPSNQQHPRRPKGIMKRARGSNITYHHPRRPLPPPLPPPGFKGNGKKHELQRKRVTFDEEQLSQQFRMSQLRRQARYKHQRSLSGMISMAMPMILPYMIAVVILVASSMVPLPATTSILDHESSSHPVMKSPVTEGKNARKFTEEIQQSPVCDIASRMWEERKKLERVQSIPLPAMERFRGSVAEKPAVVSSDTIEEEVTFESVEEDNTTSQVVVDTTPTKQRSKPKNPVVRAFNGLFRRQGRGHRSLSSSESSKRGT